MARLIWTDPALQDLDEIAAYIALDNPRAAARLVQRVFDAVERLGRFPGSGRRPPELAGLPYREVIVAPCRIFYRVERGTVYILYVMRGERMFRKYLLEERDKGK
jgi:toxin ParE1/3/4